MEERRWDGDVRLTGSVSFDQWAKAMLKKQNASVALHKPGSRVTMKDGTVYEVQPNGSWRKVAQGD